MNIIGRLRIKSVRLMLKYEAYWLNRSLESLDKNEFLAYKIVKNLLHDSRTEVRIAPNSNKKFLFNVYNKIFVKMDGAQVTIVENLDEKHRHPYTYVLPQNVMNELERRFNKKAEFDRFLFESEVMKNTNLTLLNIFNKTL